MGGFRRPLFGMAALLVLADSRGTSVACAAEDAFNVPILHQHPTSSGCTAVRRMIKEPWVGHACYYAEVFGQPLSQGTCQGRLVPAEQTLCSLFGLARRDETGHGVAR